MTSNMTTYYRAKEYRDFPDGTVLVKNELLTPREKEKSRYPDHWFERIEVDREETYWFFGARFV